VPRYELAGKFWSIELTGKSYKTQFGNIGSQGQTRIKSLAAPKVAKAAYDLAILIKHKEGYVEVVSAKPAKPKASAALEAAIDADPYDTEAYAVYADALQDAGDPRGELIALQLRNKQAAAMRLLENHADSLLGPLAPHARIYDHVYEGPRRKQVRPEAFTWKYGFIHALWLTHNLYAEEIAKPAYKLEGKLADVLKAVLSHPSGRFLAEIRFTFNNDPSGTLQDPIDVLVKHAPPTIRKLHFGDYKFASGHHVDLLGHDTEISWYSIGHLGKLWKSVPGLTHLITQGDAGGRALEGGMVLGVIELPDLVHAEIRTGGLSKANARAIVKAKIPKIEHLEIWFGEENYGGDTTAKDVQPLLDRTDLPALRHLGLRNAVFVDELIERLAACKLLEQLTELDLSLGCMTDDGVRALVDHEAFTHLAKIDVSHNFLTPDAVRLLKKTFGKALVNRAQRATDDEARYPAIGE